MTRIVEIGPPDWRLFRRVRRAALADAADAFGSTLSEWSGAYDTETRWRDRIGSAALNVIAHCGDEPVGMASLLVGVEVEIISMWIAPSVRGRGVGDAVLDHLDRWRTAHHPNVAFVLSVRTGNLPAIRLYERHGFLDTGVSPDDPDERRMTYQP